MIPIETVAQIVQQMAQTPPHEAQKLIYQMKENQPLLFDYLYYMEDLPFTQEERELVFYLGMVVCQIMEQSEPPLGLVTPDILDRVEEANYDFLEEISQDTDADFISAIYTMMDRHPEPAVFRYIVEAIMEAEEEDPYDPPVREDYAGLAFLHIKILLDALVASLDPSP